MAFVAHVSDKAHGLLVFNVTVWHFNKDITEHGMGMGKEVWSKPLPIGSGESRVYKTFNNIIF